jgi:hypothetical protein
MTSQLSLLKAGLLDAPILFYFHDTSPLFNTSPYQQWIHHLDCLFRPSLVHVVHLVPVFIAMLMTHRTTTMPLLDTRLSISRRRKNGLKADY